MLSYLNKRLHPPPSTRKEKKNLSYMNAFDYHSFYEVRSHSIILKISEFTEM